jgi:hypothetical protein
MGTSLRQQENASLLPHDLVTKTCIASAVLPHKKPLESLVNQSAVQDSGIVPRVDFSVLEFMVGLVEALFGSIFRKKL